MFVQLPVYLLHQFEEHNADRFREHVNRTIGHGREALTPGATFWINAVGVWGVDLVALYLAWIIALTAGFMAGYLAVVNGIVHLVGAVVRKEYNPGLVTALVLLLPVGGTCLVVVGRDATFSSHFIGLSVAVGLHLAIIAHVARRLKHLSKTTVQESTAS